MAEELYLEVKTNIGQATKDTKEYTKSLEQVNEQVSLQTEYIIAQEKELIKLKNQQDAIPKGAWYAGMDKLNDKIKETTADLKDEKNGLKNLKREQKEITKAIRAKTAAQKKDTNAAIRGIQHFEIMGVSIRRLRTMVRGVIPMFRLLFTTIKSGIISTGIGAIVLAIIAIGTSMKSSVAGGKAMKAMLLGLGKVVTVLTSGLTFLGDAMLSVFGFDSSTSVAVLAAEKLEKAYKDLGREMDNIAVKEAINTKKKLMNKKVTEDVTKSEKERLDALNKNMVIDLINNNDKLKNLKNILNADKEAIKLNKEKINLAIKERDGLKEARDKEDELVKAQKKTQKELAKIRTDRYVINQKFIKDTADIKQTQIDADTASANKKDELDEKLSENTKKRLADEQKALQELIDLEAERLNKLITDEAALLDQFNESQLEAQDKEKNAIYDKYFAIIEGKIALGESVAELEENQQAELFDIEEKYRIKGEAAEEASAKKKKALAKSKLDFELGMANQGLQIIGDAAGEGTAIAKAAAIAQATISGVQGVQNAFTSANANIGATAGSFGAYPVTMAALAGTFAAMNIAKIASGGGGVTPPSTPPPSVQTPSPQMMSGAFDISGGVAPEPLEAYVLTDSMTNSQNQLANIRRRATI
jgi:hypothetical protein